MEMNGSASQSSGSSASSSASQPPPTPTLLKPAPAATTPQQVAAAAAALAASRAASVSAAMRSVFGAKQQAALASAMMNASVNAAASKAKAAAASSTAATTAGAGVARATPLARPTATTATATMNHVAATSVVVMQSSFDGLPVLPSHAASCREDATTARIPSLACHAHDVPRDGAVDLYGEATSRANVRATLVQHYATTNQLSVKDHNESPSTISEMTLRMDTELEMLRRQCFAERNARWQFATPDEFAPALSVATPPVWVATPYIGPRRQTLLLRKYHDHQRLHGTDSRKASDALGETHQDEKLLQSLVGIELVRDRAWPPKEFMAKANTKPSRGGPGAYGANHLGGGGGGGTAHNYRTSSGKKKPVGMVGVVDETPVTARVCSECHTQSSALWRKRPRVVVTATAVAAGTIVSPPAEARTVPPVVTMTEEENVCLPCYLKTQRRELFERKAAEKARRAKEEAARVAAEARALKKQQQQMQKKIRKLQQLQQQQSLADEVDKSEVKRDEEALSVVDTTRRQDEEREPVPRALKLTRRESMSTASAALSSLIATSSYDKETVGNSDGAVDDKKTRGRDKKSKKDKKKKKKKKKRKLSMEDDDEHENGGWDDSDSDDDGVASRVVLPSPPQRHMDGFVYADRSDTPAVQHPQSEEDDESRAVASETTVQSEPTAKRKSHKRGASTTTTKPTAASKKRKSVSETDDLTVVVPPTPTQAQSTRRGRKAASTPTAAAAAVVVVAPPMPSASSSTPTKPATRKRGRPATATTKKESARERELRALGQYCPVCNTTYEEDDASPFVCCDSCEMWVHAACDATLTPAALATLADSNEKYICPLCGGR